jgi:uncharacterized protein
MVISELTERECIDFLQRSSLGRLASSEDNQPYVVPVRFAFESNAVYVLSTLGQKIEWMRNNPKVCFAVDEIKTESDWTSVLSFGNYQELTSPRYNDEREHAKQLLEHGFRWWQTAFAERQAKTDKQLIDPIFFRINLAWVTGLRAHPER